MSKSESTHPIKEGICLISGNRNYSSWSLRAWLSLRKSGVDPEMIVVPLDTEEYEEQIGTLSPTRRVPVLWLDGKCVWDSLAIAETCNEEFAFGSLWPADKNLRAFGRSMAAEMHSGFSALRNALPMNCRALNRKVAVDASVAAEVARVCELWHQAKQASNSKQWLLGSLSIVDCMFAPVVIRFRAYDLELTEDARDYVAFWLEDADLQNWIALAEEESWTIEHEEVGS
ncbi:MAG: glutathione S-transferase family protein [Pseudomonadota bacterium]